MPGFFVDFNCNLGAVALLTGENAGHARSLRLRLGEAVILRDGSGMDAMGIVRKMDADAFEVEILQMSPNNAEPSVCCTVYAAYAKSDKLEHVIQKSVELGASAIVPFPASRCVSRPDLDSLPKKQMRWQKIARAAAEQSGRGRIPEVRPASSFEEAAFLAAQADVPIFLYENERQLSIQTVLEQKPYQTASIMSGPEGGFSTEEAAFAEKCGMRVTTLGPRILRCETAPLCALSALMFHSGNL